MRWKEIKSEPKIFALIAKTGDEMASLLQPFAKHHGFGGSRFKGWVHWETKKYGPACVLGGQAELLSLVGDIALKDREPQVHAHQIVGRSGGPAHSGHLLEARVRPSCEPILTESPTHLQNKLDAGSGMALIQI